MFRRVSRNHFQRNLFSCARSFPCYNSLGFDSLSYEPEEWWRGANIAATNALAAKERTLPRPSITARLDRSPNNQGDDTGGFLRFRA